MERAGTVIGKMVESTHARVRLRNSNIGDAM